MPRNVNLKIVTVIAALTVAIIVLSITTVISTSDNQLLAKKHKNADSNSGSTDNNQNAADDQSAASTGGGGTDNQVTIVGIKHSKSFSPNPIDVKVGDAVTWTNDHREGHTVTSTSSEFNSGDIQPGQTFRHTFDKTGSFDYYCVIHPSMVGKVNVS
jgi:plastocyanin